MVQKLIQNGYKELVDVLLTQEDKVYTKKGRLNKSGACRILKWKPKQFDDALADCFRILTEED